MLEKSYTSAINLHLFTFFYSFTLYDILLIKNLHDSVCMYAGHTDVNTNGVLLPSAGCT